MNNVLLTSEAAQAIRQAAEWHLISLLFQTPTDAWRQRLADLARQTEDPHLGRAVQHALEQSSETLYCTTVGPGGPAALREVSHREAIQPGQFLGQLVELYAAFAYQPELPEPPDHVAYETGFVGFLCLKEAYARMSGHSEQAPMCRAAAQQFIENHLSHLAEPLAKSLAASGIDYLAAAAQALLARTGPARKTPGDSTALQQLVPDDCSSPCFDESDL